MDITANCPLATELADRMRRESQDLTRRWLDRISARVTLDPHRVFPSNELLDHVPLLVEGIADYIDDPAEEISADLNVVSCATNLGTLRLQQGFDAHEILKEYEILGGVLFAFAAREVEMLGGRCSESELLTFSHRLFRAISVIEQVTTSQYLRSLGEKVNDREEQLRRFNRMVSHELKNKVGAVLGAGELVKEEWISVAEREKFIGIVLQNARALQQVLDNLTELSRLDGDSRRQRNVMLREAVTEVTRQQRELLRAQNVRVDLQDDLPHVEVNAAAVELCLSNYLSNAAKYSKPDASEKWVKVRACIEGEDDAEDAVLVVRVQDNGIGVAEEMRDKLFERFFRANDATPAMEGTGLGLSLVKETVEAIGGRAWAEFDNATTVFAFAMPCRRRSDGLSAARVFGPSGRAAAQQV